jgi:RecA/RadA recombinase
MNKFAAKLRKIEGAVIERTDPFATENLLKWSSPGVNWIFGRNHGMPFGYSTLLWGEKKSGKSFLFYDAAGTLHRSDPDAIVIKFDTEMRDEGQLTPEMIKIFGIDTDRFVVYYVNRPEQIFDVIKNDVKSLIDDGAKIKLIGIDSISDMMGRREAEQESVTQHQIGDHAVTLQVGLKSIIATQRLKKIALIMTAHARDEMDPWEIKRGNKKKPAAANAVLHHCEFFINVDKNKTASGKVDALERQFVDENRKDMTDDGEQTGHKVRVWMENSSMGAVGRIAEFTIDYHRGIINQHEEVFRLGLNWKVIDRPSKGQYIIGDKKFIGKPNLLDALSKDVNLQQEVMSKILEMEKIGGVYTLNAANDGEPEE